MHYAYIYRSWETKAILSKHANDGQLLLMHMTDGYNLDQK